MTEADPSGADPAVPYAEDCNACIPERKSNRKGSGHVLGADLRLSGHHCAGQPFLLRRPETPFRAEAGRRHEAAALLPRKRRAMA